MKKIGVLIAFILCIACNEQLVKKPENLIPKEQMIQVLKEMAIVNAAKNTSLDKFQDNKLDPTTYVFKKFKIDSLQFVRSNKYYASKPDVYEEIYIEIDTLINREKRFAKDLKKKNEHKKKWKQIQFC